MLAFKAQSFLEITQKISASQEHINIYMNKPGSNIGKNKNIDKGLKDFILHASTEIRSLLEGMGLPVCEIIIKEMQECALTGGMTYHQANEFFKDISKNLKRELSLARFVAVESSYISYFDLSGFGHDIDVNFPSVRYDASEAAKCLSLARYTASVFHSVRALECAIRAISRHLEIDDPVKQCGRNWGNMLGEIKKAIDSRWPHSNSRSSGDGQFFEEVYAALAAIKNPWRNATMHLEKKYTADEAKYIFDVVKNLFGKLSVMIDEEGKRRHHG